MRNNETGEFELVVGNRQLLSGFFIVVLLFAVGVALGYILGQNSEKAMKAGDTASTIPQSAQSRPQPASPIEPTSAQPPAQAPAQADSAAPGAADSPAPTTVPARDTASAATPPVQVPAAAPPAAPPAANSQADVEPPPGTYWQVMALARTDADVMVRTLKDKGFPAVTSPGTKGLTRVLVGPYADRQALSRAKSDLEAAGMSTPYRVEVGDAGRK